MFKAILATGLVMSSSFAWAYTAECDFVVDRAKGQDLHLYTASITDNAELLVGVEPDCQHGVTHFKAHGTHDNSQDGMLSYKKPYSFEPRSDAGVPYCLGAEVPVKLLLDGTTSEVFDGKSVENATLELQGGKVLDGYCYYF